MRLNEFLEFRGISRGNPAGKFEPAHLEADGKAILRVQPFGEDIKLQGADDSRNRARSIIWQKELDDTFLGHLAKSLAQLLRLHGITGLDTAKDLGREARNTAKDEILAFRQSIADPQRAVVWYADNIARIGFLGELAVLREEKLRRVERDILACADELCLHAAHQFARADAQKSNPVAMIWIHVRLDLENKTGHFRFMRVNGPRPCLECLRRRRESLQRVDQVAHAEIAQGAAEIDRCQMALQIGLMVESLETFAGKLDLAARLLEIRFIQEPGNVRIAGAFNGYSLAVMVEAPDEITL